MSTWKLIKRVRVWEWTIFVISVLCLAMALGMLHGCAGVRSAIDPLERHGTQLGIGTAAGAGAGLLAGATGWGLIVAALVGSAVTIFSTPDCAEIAKQQAAQPMFSTVQYVIAGAVIYVLWIRRQRVMDGIRSGSFKALAAHWGHAFLGLNRPKES